MRREQEKLEERRVRSISEDIKAEQKVSKEGARHLSEVPIN